MALTFINSGEKVSKQDIESCPKWFSFDVDFGTADGALTLIRTAEDVVILDAFIDCFTAATGGTASTATLTLSDTAGDNAQVMVGTNDNLGAVGRDTGTAQPVPSDYPRPAGDQPESLLVQYSAGGATGAPQARCGVLMYRLERPGSIGHLPEP